MRIREFLKLGCLLSLSLLVAACGGGSPPTTSDSASATLTGASAVSSHYVKARFDRPVGPSGESATQYQINTLDGRPLAIQAVTLNSDGTEATLTTAEQNTVQYRLSYGDQTGSRTLAGKAASAGAGSVTFDGSIINEPILVSAIALSSTSVLLTFSDRMDEGADNPLFYRISNPNLAITAADVSNDGTTVLLTTEPQADLQYEVVATNIKSHSNKLLHPTLNTATFYGMPPVDTVAPRVTNAVAASNTSVLISFSEPLALGADDPINFSISPSLVITAASLTQHGTQIVLTTSPQTAGVEYTVTVNNVSDKAGNNIDSAANNATFSIEATVAQSSAEAWVTGANSRNNKTVLVAYSKAMGDSAIDPGNYVIVQLNENSEVGYLQVTGARFVDSNRREIILDTLSQNEVTYRLTVTAVKDLAGNSIVSRIVSYGVLLEPSSWDFPGTPPSGTDFVDSDNDGLTDDEEQRGWAIYVWLSNGTVEERQVTSDPLTADTDGDGLDDREEQRRGSNPRDRDSDRDTVVDADELRLYFTSLVSQDSDGDGINDGSELFFFKTSPLLTDTDGDQLLDGEEIVLANRDPRIADLPRPKVQIGNVNLALDTRFSYTDTAGQSVQEERNVATTLTKGENETFSTSDEESTITTIGTSSQLEAEATFPKGGGIKATVGATSGLEEGHTSTFGSESSISAEEAFHESLSTSTTRDYTQSVSREVVDGSIKLDVTIENASDVPFSIGNLELSALVQDPRDRRRFVPLASLVPENANLTNVNVGTLGDTGRGPFVFTGRDVFPAQIQELLKNPRGLIVKLANFDITDESGRNFAFISQEVLDRTAGITIDYGDGRVESHRVATSSTFEPSGGPRGITMRYALNDILGLSKYASILDGGDGIVDTVAQGDDEQVVAVGGWVTPGEVIIRAGANGVLDTPVNNAVTSDWPDDRIKKADYATARVDRDVDGDGVIDKQVEILTRVRDRETGMEDLDPNDGIDDRQKFWAVFSQKEVYAGIDFDNIVMKAGDQFSLTFVQDKDQDGVWAREEYLYGSFDLDPDSDDDGLDDKQEIQQGWVVQVRGSRLANQVYPNPVQQDSDRDGLTDYQERACGLDPRQRDTDLDGLSDYEELFGVVEVDGIRLPMTVNNPASGVLLSMVPIYSGSAILDGGNGLANTIAAGASDDVQLAFSSVALGGVVVSGGADQILQTTPAGDDIEGAPHEVFGDCAGVLGISGFALDPLNPDTDGDHIEDGAELKLGINPNYSKDGPLFLDDDGDGVPNLIEREGFLATVNGNSVLMFSSPTNPDSDADGLPDLLEHYLGSNPQIADTDGDGLSDFNEYKGGGLACVTVVAAQQCMLFKDKLDGNYQQFLDNCGEADVCPYDEAQDLAGSDQLGTNLNESDTDFDGLADPVELAPYSITIDDVTTILEPFSDPLKTNSDTDGWNDGQERTAGTNPNAADSDGDGTDDDDEPGRGRNPRYKDKRVQLRYDRIVIVGDCERFLYGTGPGEFRWSLNYQTAAQVAAGEGPYTRSEWKQSTDYSIDGSATVNLSPPASPVRFVARYGAQFRLQGFVQELDDGGADGTLSWDNYYNVNGSLSSSTPIFSTTNPEGNCDNADWSVEASIIVD